MMKKSKKTLSVIVLILLAVILTSVLSWGILKNKKENEAIPTINLVGEENIKLQLGEEYKEIGVIAILEGKNITNKVEKYGEVNTNKVGRYEITYNVSNNKNKNEVTTKRTIDVIDSVPPQLTLVGEEKISIYVGENYNEQGATAIDNYDGDITSKISISGSVNNTKAGNYTIKYHVQDSSANVKEITRTITVKNKKIVTQTNSSSGEGLPILMYHFFYDKNVSTGKDSNWMEISKFEEQMKYLSENNFYFPSWKEVEDYIDGKITLPRKSVVITVDDGDPSFFKLAVPIIKKYNIKATSFVVASWYAWDAVKYKSENVIIQSHSYNMHRPGNNGKGILLSYTYERILEDIKASQKDLGGATVFAYPFGQYNSQAKEVLKDAGIKLALTTKNGKVYKGSNKLELPRRSVNAGISFVAYKNIVE